MACLTTSPGEYERRVKQKTWVMGKVFIPSVPQSPRTAYISFYIKLHGVSLRPPNPEFSSLDKN